MAVPSHLRSADDLVTKEEAVRAGFLAIAVERSRLSVPFVAQAQALKVAAISAGSVERCVADAALRPAMLAAAGVSDKGAGHLTDADKDIAIKNLAETYMAPAGTGYVDELVFRYLLAKGGRSRRHRPKRDWAAGSAKIYSRSRCCAGYCRCALPLA